MDGFVEVLDQDGQIGLVLFHDSQTNEIDVIRAGTPEAVRYGALFGVRFCPLLTPQARQLLTAPNLDPSAT